MNTISLTEEELKQIEYYKVLSSKTRFKILKLIKEGEGKYNLLQIRKILNCSYQGLLSNLIQLKNIGLVTLNQNVNEIGKPIYPVVKEDEL